LNIQHAEDLLESLTNVFKAPQNQGEIVVDKRYQRNVNLEMKFTVASTTGERVVIVTLSSSDIDSISVVLPLKPVFQSFMRRLKNFVNSFDMICYKLLIKTLDFELKEDINRIPNLIKSIPNSIIKLDKVGDGNLPVSSFREFDNGGLDSLEYEYTKEKEEVEPQNIEQTAEEIEDLDKFLGENMSSVDIPELHMIDEEKPKKIIIESNFVTKFLDSSISVLDDKLNLYAVSQNAVEALRSDLRQFLDIDILRTKDVDDKKSLLYVSEFFIKYHMTNWIQNNVEPPMSLPILYYEPSEIDEASISLAKDVLTVICFTKLVRDKLRNVTSNPYDNKSMIYLLLRVLFDPICFPYIKNLKVEDLVESTKNRFQYFQELGFFQPYEHLLERSGFEKIQTGDVKIVVEKISSTASNIVTISKLHSSLCEKGIVKLPQKNDLSEEQIVREFIPLEVKLVFSKDKDLKELTEKQVSDKVLSYFDNKKKKKLVGKTITPLQRMIEKFKQDIPEKYRDEVIEFVKNLGFEKVDMKELPWPLEEFDDRIVKAFYVWDPKSDEKMKTNFSYFASLVENEVMSKFDIILTNNVSNTNSNGWDNVFD